MTLAPSPATVSLVTADDLPALPGRDLSSSELWQHLVRHGAGEEGSGRGRRRRGRRPREPLAARRHPNAAHGHSGQELLVRTPPLWRMGQYSISDTGVMRRFSVSHADELRPLG